MLAFESKAKYRITQDGKLISFHRSDRNLTVNYPLDGTEGTAEFRSAASRKARVSGRWLPDGKTLELKTAFQAEDGSPSAFRITEQMVLSPDKRMITLRRTTTGGRQIQDQTLVYRRVEADAPAAQPSVTRNARVQRDSRFLAHQSRRWKSASSPAIAEQATKFFAEGIGLVARGEPRGGAAGAAMRMLLFSAGSSNVKVRVYPQPPAKLPADIAARNGLRVLTIPVERLDDVVARLKRLGFEVTDVKQAGEVRWALARNADGTAFELVEAKPGAARELEIGLVVPDLAKAREFFTGVYGAKELPEATSRVLPGEKELRFTTGATVFKCWAPKGERESDTGQDSRRARLPLRDPQRPRRAGAARRVHGARRRTGAAAFQLSGHREPVHGARAGRGDFGVRLPGGSGCEWRGRRGRPGGRHRSRSNCRTCSSALTATAMANSARVRCRTRKSSNRWTPTATAS